MNTISLNLPNFMRLIEEERARSLQYRALETKKSLFTSVPENSMEHMSHMESVRVFAADRAPGSLLWSESVFICWDLMLEFNLQVMMFGGVEWDGKALLTGISILKR